MFDMDNLQQLWTATQHCHPTNHFSPQKNFFLFALIQML